MFKKYIFPLIISSGLIMSNICPVFAAPTPLFTATGVSLVANSGQTAQPVINKQVRKTKAGGQNLYAGAPVGLNLTADAAVLIDAASGQILYAKQAHKRRPPASTTKIMTTILALEYGDPAQVVTVSDHAARVGESTIHLDPGEKLTLGNLIEGALIKSGNDACVAIAEHIAGSEEAFIRLMNAKAKALGAYDTNFANTNGLPNSNHYSTAYDLALMARYGMHLEKFSEITKTKEAAIEFIEPHSTLQVKNTNKLLWMYEFADGVKTGTTNAAGKCLVSSATKDGRQLIAVVLHSPARFQDSMRLLEYGFNNFKPTKLGSAGDVVGSFAISNGIDKFTPVVLGSNVEFLTVAGELDKVKSSLILTRSPSAPVTAGEELGRIEYSLQGQVVGQAPVYASRTVLAKPQWQRWLEKLQQVRTEN